MRTLVIGQGGREHALVKALNKSPDAASIFVAPGNEGMSLDAEIVNLDVQNLSAVVSYCKSHEIQLVIIGPEAELVTGLADELQNNNILCFGPSQKAAQLEGSKIFCKEFLNEFHIPTAKSDIVRSVADVKSVLKSYTLPYVLKADGLCGGKGVYICKSEAELLKHAEDLFNKKSLGKAGSNALIEQFQPGYELSLLYLTNGKDFSLLPICQDHKRLSDNDQGPNTGGMGVVGPVKVDKKLLKLIEEKILAPIRNGFEKRNFNYRGVLYVGLMVTEGGPQVLEFNVRFGDPEAQVILPLLDGDWVEVFKTIAEGGTPHLTWRDEFAACVVMAAEGYPKYPKKNIRIEGDAHKATLNSYFIHAGTKRSGDHYVTNGGRVLNAVGVGIDLKSAIAHAYAQASFVNWPGMQMRKDIGKSFASE